MAPSLSAASFLALLHEPDPTFRSFALRKLDQEVDLLWTEIAGSLDVIESLYEDESFPDRSLAARVVSRVYYHLQEYNEAMAFALGSGKYFNVDRPGQYEDTVVGRCVDTFIALSAARDINTLSKSASKDGEELERVVTESREGFGGGAATGLMQAVAPFSLTAMAGKSLLSRADTVEELAGVVQTPEMIVQQRGLQKQLSAVIERLFEKCFQEKRYRQVVGIAVEARNLDILRRVIVRAARDEKTTSGDATKAGEELMEYVLDICMSVVQEKGLRNEILKLILELLNEIPSPDYFAIAKCVIYLDQHSLASDILRKLIEKGDARSLAVAYQISFDLYDNSTQEFLRNVREELAQMAPEEEKVEANTAMEEDKDDGEAEDQLQHELDESAGTPLLAKTKAGNTVQGKEKVKALTSCREILDGLRSIHLNIEFLYKSNRVDITVLNKIKDSLEARNSIYHTATTLASAFMHAKTANDKFFRDNLEWLGKAVNWSKFTVTAALGVIHQGNINHVDRLLSPYLPKPASGGPVGGSPYSQGGSLYAYGLVCANHKGKAVDFLRPKFKEATDETVQHGGALGLGVAGMASGDLTLYDDFKQVLYADSAINGEAIGLAMGLVMLGSADISCLQDMITYAHETQHEKIVRGLAMGISMIMYGQQEGADELVTALLNDPSPTLRYGGVMTLAMAYAGTGSNKAVRKLLHVAVSDVSDDVRRIAVLALGFILFRKHTSVPRMVELLAESYNPHVRYGAAMALGISCAGTGLDEAIDLLEPMLKDPTDFVRQGALIALSMILIQQNDALNPKVSEIRKKMLKIVTDRHEDAMCKFGCAMALGIIDAGGRNCTISLQTQTGNLHMPGIVGMAVFIQYWYWFPMAHFLSLSFTPTAIIAVDQKLEVPVFKFHSNSKPSLFDYPPEETTKVDAGPEKVKTAVLSTTAQAKRRAAKKAKETGGEGMDVDTPTTPKVDSQGDKMEIDDKDDDATVEGDAEVEGEEEADKKEGEKKKEEAQTMKAKLAREKAGYDLANMSRVLPAQMRYISFPETRYKPVKKPVTGGVVVVIDSEPEKERETISLNVSKERVAAGPAANAGNVGRAAFPSTAGMRGAGTTGGINTGNTGSVAGSGIAAAAQAALGNTGNNLVGRGLGPGAVSGGLGLGTGLGAGAAAAAGVLTAVDEDGDDGEEAEVPGEFDYETEDDEMPEEQA